MSFLPERRTIGIKIEGTPYTAETLAATDFDVQAYNINYDPEIQMMARKVARGDFSKECSIAGKRSLTITFSFDLAFSGTATTPPKFAKIWQSCALVETVLAGGVTYVTNSDYSNVPVTIEIVEKEEGASPTQVVIKGKGGMGNAKIICDEVGNPARVDVEYKLALVSITDRAFGSILTPTGMTDEKPDAILSASISNFSESQRIGGFSIDLGNDVQLFSDPDETSGYQGAHVVTRNPTVEMDPDLETIANRGDYARWTDMTTGTLSIEVGDNITLSAPAAQIIKDYTPGNREGHTTKTKTLELKRSSGDDEFKILQGTE